MKKHYKYLVLLLLLPYSMFSNEDKFAHSKQKNIKITYLVNPDASLAITNSYGSITVMTWDEDKVDLDVTIKASSNNENWVNQRISDINIDINALKSIVSATTVIGSSSSTNSSSSSNFEINYIIKIPKNSNNVTLNNKYGNIYTSELSSSTNFFCKYGMLTLGKLNSAKNSITMEYCDNSTISFLNTAVITAKYSNITIGQLSKLDLISEYTDVDIQEGKEVKYSSKYGSIEVDNIQDLDGLGNYLKVKIGNLNGNLNLNTKYSDIVINNASIKTNKIDIVSSYTNTRILYDENLAFNFDFYLKYANLKYGTDFNFINKEETNTAKKYMGYYKKKAATLIKISSDFGNITVIKK